MPRKSAIARELQEIALPRVRPRLVAPVDLTAEQQNDWLKLAARLPEELPVDQVAPLLNELVRHMSFARQISEELTKLRSLSLADEDVLSLFTSLLKVHERQSMRIAVLLQKLRLTPQAREEYHNSETRRRHPRLNGPRPWDSDAVLELEALHVPSSEKN
jgi:hypothetical protein